MAGIAGMLVVPIPSGALIAAAEASKSNPTAVGVKVDREDSKAASGGMDLSVIPKTE